MTTTVKWKAAKDFTSQLYAALDTTTMDGEPTIAYDLIELSKLLQDLVIKNYAFTKVSEGVVRILGNIALFLVEYHHVFKISKSLFPRRLVSVFDFLKAKDKQRKQAFRQQIKKSSVVKRIQVCLKDGLNQRGIKYDDKLFHIALDEVDDMLAFLQYNDAPNTNIVLDEWYLYTSLFGLPDFFAADPALLMFLYCNILPIVKEKFRAQKFRQKTTAQKVKQFFSTHKKQ